MTTGQKIGWGVGILLLVIVVIVIFMNKDKVTDLFTGTPPTIPPNFPAYCDKERFGYDIYGNANSNCGVIGSEPYTAPCNPDKPGYDMNNFANPDCGFGRKGR